MTALPEARPRAFTTGREGFRGWIGIAAMLLVLAAIVGARWVAVAGGVNGLFVGAGFALALAALWFAGARVTPGQRLAAREYEGAASREGAASHGSFGVGVAAGIAFGLLLVTVTLAGAAVGDSLVPSGLSRPAAPFAPWALITVAVATAEEGILRGVLLDRVRAIGGLPVAMAVTTVAFALLHVPLYGWHVVPLDLAVGLGLAGLRLATRSIVAPAVAHAVADLATWWL